MALTVETGAGLSNAEAFGSLAAYRAWHTASYGADDLRADGVLEAAIRRAVAFMNTLPWNGTRTTGRVQALSWPRAGVSDSEGFAIGANEVPREVPLAQNIFAREEATAPGLLAPVVQLSQEKVLIEVDGIKWKPLADSLSVENARPQVTAALDLLYGLLKPTLPATLPQPSLWSVGGGSG